MDLSDKNSFTVEKQRAAERLRELSARSKYKQASCGAKNAAEHKPSRREPDSLSGFNLPFLSDIGADSDTALILGLVLILSAEKSDRLLLLALLYILI